MLDALTFDFWGTLYHGAYGVEPRLDLIEESMARHGEPRSRDSLRAAYDHAWAVVDAIWRNEHRSLSVGGWLDEILRYIGAYLPLDARADLIGPIEEVLLNDGEGPVLVPGVAAAVPRLARRYRLGLISDVGLSPGRVLREVLRRDGLLPHFSVLTFSDEVGATKPVPMVFLRTLAALGSDPDRAAHIGDLPETDLAGAKAAGMHAVLFLGASRREDGLALADASFQDYAELEPLLERLGRSNG